MNTQQKNSLRNMTAISLILLFILSFVSAPLSFAVTPTPKSPTPSAKPSQNQVPENGEELEKIQKIKDIVASKVAELNLVEKRGIIGTITDITGMKVSIKDIKSSTRQIDIDELTKFDISDDDKAGISDLKKGTTYSFVGIYNKETQRLLARNISTTNTIPIYFEGAIQSVNEKEFQITLVDEGGQTKKVDIQSSTKTSLADSGGDLVKSGFSKLEQNSRVLAIGFLDKKDKNLISALRVIHFEDVPPSKKMQGHVKIDN